jgi:hypothetical protein
MNENREPTRDGKGSLLCQENRGIDGQCDQPHDRGCCDCDWRIFEPCYCCKGAGKVTPEHNARLKAIECQSLLMQARGYPLEWEGREE